MKFLAWRLFVLSCLGSVWAQGQLSSFKHIVVIVQENRSPDNLFQGLCSPPYGTSASCSATPTGSQYNILTANWLDKTSSTGTTQPGPVPLANAYDLGHRHISFMNECDRQPKAKCAMDGAANDTCMGTCPTKPAFKYVDNSTGIVNPYLDLASQYGWANYMFQTNQGPSFPAHQFLFGGTSAPSGSDDAAGIFASENTLPKTAAAGCVALSTTTVMVIDPTGEHSTTYPCFEHTTLSDLLDPLGISWKYYTPSAGSIWTAPNAIQHICMPNAPTGGTCEGSEWLTHVVLKQTQALTDISKCQLPNVSWVIPVGADSDHPSMNKGTGPAWVASIVNAIGNNPKCKNGETYWNDTAIVITWDDWGGWYDHEPPTFLAEPEGDYQYGFRVPLIVVSAYTTAAYVNNDWQDFGSVLRFVEKNFGVAEGALGFADARSTTDLTGFFNLSGAPRVFTPIAAPLGAQFFLHDTRPATDPDDY